MQKSHRKCPPAVLRPLLLLTTILLSASMAGCGHSEEEWQQKLRENENLRNQLAAQTQAYKKCEADHSDALAQIDDLKNRLTERGVNIDNLSATLAQEKKALEEYRRRAEQLDEIRKRFELLRSKLNKLTNLGLKVEVRDNRMLIQLPGDVLFDSGRDKLWLWRNGEFFGFAVRAREIGLHRRVVISRVVVVAQLIVLAVG
jgi:chemotaxis protein MotB